MDKTRVNFDFSERDMSRIAGLSASSGNKPREVIKDAINVAADYVGTTKQGYTPRAVSRLLYTEPTRCYLDQTVATYTPYSGPISQPAGRLSMEISDKLKDAVNLVAGFIEAHTRHEATRYSLRVFETFVHLKGDGVVFEYVPQKDIREMVWAIGSILPHIKISDGQGIRIS